MTRANLFQQTHMMCSVLPGDRIYKHDRNCTRRDAATLEDEIRNEGAAIAFGIIGMFEAIKANPTFSALERCSVCDFDPRKGHHWNDAYDDTLYVMEDDSVRCGPCADESRMNDVATLSPSDGSEGSVKR